MAYTLHRLAPGSYDILLNGEVIGSIVRNVSAQGDIEGWDNRGGPGSVKRDASAQVIAQRASSIFKAAIAELKRRDALL